MSRSRFEASSFDSHEPASPISRRTTAGAPLSLSEEIRDLLRYPSLLRELVHRDLTIRYRRSVLGFLWTMLHPLLLMLIFVVVFSGLFRFQTPHYETYFLSEYLAWIFFAQTTSTAMASVAWNGPLMKRVRVPLTIFTLSTTISGAINFALSLGILFVIMGLTGVPMRATLLLLPVSVVLLSAFTFGASLALTALSVFFADVREMYQAGIPAVMYLTPIIYPVAIIPEKYRMLIRLNPVVYLLEIVRDPIYYGIIPAPRTLALAAVISVGSLVFGWMIFRRLAPRFYGHL
jgi:homopolymeric O-antigen transport system permease protein